MRTILVVLVDRANFGRMWPVMQAIQEHPDLELRVLCAGSMVLERFGSTHQLVTDKGFTIDSKIYMEVEGSAPVSMAKSVGLGVIEFSSEILRIKPDIALIIGDRLEALAAAIAAAYCNIPVAHIQGGEVSGSIDESARHAITKFAHYHFPATARAADYVRRMGEAPRTVFQVGCPCGDFIRLLDHQLPPEIFQGGNPDVKIDPAKPFNVVIFHPVTTDFGGEREQVLELLTALDELQHPTVWLWPNIDAGSDHISKELRRFASMHHPKWLKFLVNLNPENFQRVLANAACAIGNSSSFVRDSTFTGLPVVLVGDRQQGREIGANVICTPPERASVLAAVRRQLAHGRYEPGTLYGTGRASEQIAEKLAEVPLYLQKRLDYVNAEGAGQ